MIRPKFITFTGIDERTDPRRVMELSKRYPIEWGILFSRQKQGQAQRYPSLDAMGRFLRATDVSGIRLSAHICGRYSRDIFTGGGRVGEGLRQFMGGRFDRTQINIADGETSVEEKDARPEIAAEFAKSIWAEKAIIQCRGNFPDDPAVDWLYDRSGGAGVVPDNWDAAAFHTGAFCGYAGGIGPDNVVDVLEKIGWVHPKDKPFWIDMEGKIRSEEWLDLDKCEAVAKAVYG